MRTSVFCLFLWAAFGGPKILVYIYIYFMYRTICTAFIVVMGIGIEHARKAKPTVILKGATMTAMATLEVDPIESKLLSPSVRRHATKKSPTASPLMTHSTRSPAASLDSGFALGPYAEVFRRGCVGYVTNSCRDSGTNS